MHKFNNNEIWYKELVGLINACWHYDATLRPTFEQIATRLANLYSELDKTDFITGYFRRFNVFKDEIPYCLIVLVTKFIGRI